MRDALRRLHFDISQQLDEIKALFTNPDACKVTLVIRTTDLENGGVVITDDDYDAAIAEINRLRDASDAHLTGGVQ